MKCSKTTFTINEINLVTLQRDWDEKKTGFFIFYFFINYNQQQSPCSETSLLNFRNNRSDLFSPREFTSRDNQPRSRDVDRLRHNVFHFLTNIDVLLGSLDYV